MKLHLKSLLALLLAALLALSVIGVAEDGLSIEENAPALEGLPVEADPAADLDVPEAIDDALSLPEDLPTPETVCNAAPTVEATSNALTTKVKIGVKEKYTIDTASLKGTLTFKSSKKAVAIVTKKGVVTGKKAGTAKITIKTSKGKKYTVTVTVAKAPSKVTLNKTKATLETGDTLKLKATLPGKTASKKLTWTSSNKKVATVSKSGKVTAKKAGTATITVKTFNGKKATCTVTVIDPDEVEETPEPSEEPTPTPRPEPKILNLSGGLPQTLYEGFSPTKQKYIIDQFKCEVVPYDSTTFQYRFSFGGVKTDDYYGNNNFTHYPINWEMYADYDGKSVLVDRGVIWTPMVRVGDRWSLSDCTGLTFAKLPYNPSYELWDNLHIHTVLS